MHYKVNVLINKDTSGYYVYCPELPCCQSQGDTFEEAMINIKEALELYLETMSSENIKSILNNELITTTLEVKIN